MTGFAPLRRAVSAARFAPRVLAVVVAGQAERIAAAPSSWSAAGRRCADGPADPRPLAGPPQSCGLARLPGSTAPPP